MLASFMDPFLCAESVMSFNGKDTSLLEFYGEHCLAFEGGIRGSYFSAGDATSVF